MDVVVRLTSHGEDATNALQSVINNHKHFAKVHVICSFYEKHKEPFKGFDAFVDALKGLHIEVKVVGEFQCDDTKGDCLIGVHPYCVLRSGGVTKLHKVITELEKQKNTQVMHFGITTTMIAPTTGDFMRDFLDAILGYGFLLITFYLDMWWRIWSRGKFYLSTDVCASFINSTYHRKYIPALSRMSRLWDNEQAFSAYGEDSAVLKPEPKMRGFRLARYIVNTHNKQGTGLWLFVFFLFFYYWLAYPWWNHLTIPGASIVLVRPVLGPLNLILYIFTVAILYMGSSYYLIVPHQGLLCLMLPFYITLYPLFWAYARLYRPRETWNI